MKMLKIIFKKIFIFSILFASLHISAEVDIPKGFRLLVKDFGAGSYSRVHIVESRRNRKKYAFKVAVDPSNPRSAMNYRKQLAAHYGWTLMGLTSAEMIYDPRNDHYLLHELVEGPTLAQSHQEEGFNLQVGDPRTAALRRLLSTLVKNNVFISDLNADNIVFDGEEWQIIDSTGFKLKESYRKTFEAYFKKLTTGKKWSGRVANRSVLAFLNRFRKNTLFSIEKKSPLPDPGFQEFALLEREAKLTEYRGILKIIPSSYLSADCQDLLKGKVKKRRR